jgi:hypothetical protein
MLKNRQLVINAKKHFVADLYIILFTSLPGRYIPFLRLSLFKAYVYQRLGEAGRIVSPVTVEQQPSLVYDPSVPPPSYHPPYNTVLQQVDSRFIQGKPHMAFGAGIQLVIPIQPS